MKSLYVIPIYFLSFLDNERPDVNIIGTWTRYTNQHLIEIFIVRDNGEFISNEFNQKNELRNIEKGTWEIKHDSIQFRFIQVITSEDSQNWKSVKASQLKSVIYKFMLNTDGNLIIGSSIYYRE